MNYVQLAQYFSTLIFPREDFDFFNILGYLSRFV
jgi:hypothetical protein